MRNASSNDNDSLRESPRQVTTCTISNFSTTPPGVPCSICDSKLPIQRISVRIGSQISAPMAVREVRYPCGTELPAVRVAATFHRSYAACSARRRRAAVPSLAMRREVARRPSLKTPCDDIVSDHRPPDPD